MKLIIEDDEGRKTVVALAQDEITIGRDDANAVRLPERNVSRHHARLRRSNGALLIEDLGSYNGVRINGEIIAEPTPVKEGDLIEIGDYDLAVEGRLEAPPPPRATVPPPRVTMPPSPVARTIPPASPTARTIPPTSSAAKTIPPGSQIVHRTMPPAPPPDGARSASATTGTTGASASVGGATAIIRVSDVMKNVPQVEARDLQKTEMPRLVGLTGAIRGKEFFLMRSEVRVGRSEDNDIAIDHQSLSRQHARFVLEDAAWKVIDNRSANGIFINGEQYAVGSVSPGDTLELGHLKFRFCGPGERFTLAPEKAEEAKPAIPAPEPVAAVREAPRPQPARSLKVPLPIAIATGAIVAAALAGVVFFGKGKRADQVTEGELSGAESVRAGDREFKKHDFIKALEYYDAAVVKGETPANRAAAQDEARAQEIGRALDRAIAAGDFDKARALYDKCAGEMTWYCRQVQEKADQIRAGFAKAHLLKAQNAKAAGKTDLCRQELQQVLALDAANGEAQNEQCVAPAPAQAAKPAPVRRTARAAAAAPAEGDAERDRKARELIEQGNAKLAERDFSAANASFHGALDLRPSDEYVGYAYRGLGTVAIYNGDTKAAAKWYKLYLPYADPASKKQIEIILRRNGEEPAGSNR
ncbi:MAG TPA: FHA domain-containing protein [Myxococcales bacterium]|nr:FHA domain-containing protein [Myxococcales bacterium]